MLRVSCNRLLNFVGVRATGSLAPSWYGEHMSSKSLAPADLHGAMVATRQSRLAALVPQTLPDNASVSGYVANSKYNGAAGLHAHSLALALALAVLAAAVLA